MAIYTKAYDYSTCDVTFYMIKLRRKLTFMEAKLSVLEHSEAKAFRVVKDVPPSLDVDDYFCDAGC